jgi:hypothetical protein
MDLFAMAWRNVFRNGRRSFVTIAAMSLALLVMILYSGLIEGYLDGMERNVLDLEVGDLQIFAQEYRTDPSIYTKIDDPQALLDRLVGTRDLRSRERRGLWLSITGRHSISLAHSISSACWSSSFRTPDSGWLGTTVMRR